ncbi:hypothetical protein CLOSTMETH_01085 [[Clostridium] methylpentosum DSM 5476]|uniref:Uncharacterized protein n=1 Tax=[Clostridium] methylpentosum DSM 5476 TaxID=537013 RepID=C0EB68_9FIRM|nr:hypothetical protein CLOSTMETH_01085 [[Clostridium] methylpentosum DSM 5476]
MIKHAIFHCRADKTHSARQRCLSLTLVQSNGAWPSQNRPFNVFPQTEWLFDHKKWVVKFPG